jgi:hypothetical protein
MAIRSLLNSLRLSHTYDVTIVSIETYQLLCSLQFNDNLSEIRGKSNKTASSVLRGFVP